MTHINKKESKNINLKSIITRIGNKSKYIKYFEKYIPRDYNTYIEPFVGSGSLLLYLKPKKFIINDINKELIDIWKLLKDDPKYLINKVKLFRNKYLKLTTNEDKLIFLKNETEKLNNMKYSINKSILWLTLNRMSYRGSLNISKNKFKFGSINNINDIIPIIFKIEFSNRILNINNYFINNKNNKIYNKDYKEILKKAKQGDFIFLDPPYLCKLNDYNYNTNENINNNFIIELYNECKKLDHKNVKWMMTQKNTKEIKYIFKEYKIRKYKIYRIFQGKYEYELFITNY